MDGFGTDVYEFAGRGILLDIEGTTSSIRFVTEVMFPYVRRHVHDFLRAHGTEPDVLAACDRIARDAGAPSFALWTAGMEKSQATRRLLAEVARLMDADAKTTGLKELQGLVWKEGFHSGELLGHVYPDVPPALSRWRSAGVDLRVFSSGSVAAQKLFFGHTAHGDLAAFFSGHYDTSIGPKRVPESYHRIAEDWELPAREILFLSDVAEELDAARAAGFQTAQLARPDNLPEPSCGANSAPPAQDAKACFHPRLADFNQIQVR